MVDFEDTKATALLLRASLARAFGPLIDDPEAMRFARALTTHMSEGAMGLTTVPISVVYSAMLNFGQRVADGRLGEATMPGREEIYRDPRLRFVVERTEAGTWLIRVDEANTTTQSLFVDDAANGPVLEALRAGRG